MRAKVTTTDLRRWNRNRTHAHARCVHVVVWLESILMELCSGVSLCVEFMQMMCRGITRCEVKQIGEESCRIRYVVVKASDTAEML